MPEITNSNSSPKVIIILIFCPVLFDKISHNGYQRHFFADYR